MRDVLIDVRWLQNPKHAQTEAGRRAYALLSQARTALPRDELVGLADPALAPLPDDARTMFDRVRLTGYVGNRARPACFVQLSPLTHDPIFVARLLEDPSIVCVAVAPGSTPDGDGIADRIRTAVARYWLGRYDLEVAEATLWDTVAGLGRLAAVPAVITGRRAQILFMAPTPEDGLRRALESLGDIHMPASELSVHAMRPRYDRVVGVVANTDRHAAVVATLARFGGACIVRDGSLLQAYAAGRRARARKLAGSELGRPVMPEELNRWINGHTFARARLLGEVAGAAETLLVHSEKLARAMQAVYGRSASVLPVPLSVGLVDAGQQLPGRVPAAEWLLLASASGLMAESCVWMLDVFRHWGVSACLHLVGSEASDWHRVQALSAQLGLADRVALSQTDGPEPTGADVGIFLGMRGQGSCGLALAEAAARGLPCVASESVAEPFNQPGWVRTIPDLPSPVLLAEAVAAALSHPVAPERVRAWTARNTPEALARRLAEALGLG